MSSAYGSVWYEIIPHGSYNNVRLVSFGLYPWHTMWSGRSKVFTKINDVYMEMYMLLHAFILVSLFGFISWSPRRRLSAKVCFIHSAWHDGKQLCHFYCGLSNVLTGFTWCFYSLSRGSFTGSWVVAGFSQCQWSKHKWYPIRSWSNGMCCMSMVLWINWLIPYHNKPTKSKNSVHMLGYVVPVV